MDVDNMRNYIKQGNCLELMKEIADNSIDMILCDLPYGTTACDWDVVIPLELLWERYNRIIKDSGAIVLFSAQPFTTALINSNLKHYRYNWYWKKNNKTGFSYAKYQPMRCIEDICVFYKKAPTYKPQGLVELKNPKTKYKKPTTKDTTFSLNKTSKPFVSRYTNYPTHLLEFANEVVGNKGRLHPTQKPVALLEYLIKTYTNEGDVVLDNCMGSGSTCVAAVNTKRHYIGFELDEKYYNIAKQRIEEVVFLLP
jgi:site-specific DNA-methyltransferase (adenine-specific)